MALAERPARLYTAFYLNSERLTMTKWPDHDTYLVFDIETYPDRTLIREVHGEELPQYRSELAQRTGSDFLPTVFHIPIAVASVKVGGNFQVLSLDVRTAPIEQEREILEYFWTTCNALAGSWPEHPPSGQLVSFNGSDFDLRVLEQRALKYGVKCNTAFRNPQFHFDIPVFLANFQSTRKHGLTLKALSKLIGLPGKSLLEGREVEAAYEQGELNRIGEYCLLDAVETYLLFVRCQVLMGASYDGFERATKAILTYTGNSVNPFVRGLAPYLERRIYSARRSQVG